MHAFLHRIDEGSDISRRSLNLNLHPAIGKIPHITGHLKFFGYLQNRISKTHSLDMSAVKNRSMLNMRHIHYITFQREDVSMRKMPALSGSKLRG